MTQPPRLPRSLGLAGLLPHIAAVLVLLGGDPATRFLALALAYAYAALILSFLGGLWWGLAARADQPPAWLWIVSVVPSLLALASAIPWATGAPWPGPSLIVLGIALLAALTVDRAIARRGLAPDWWMALRVPLSVGLGLLTILIAFL